MEPYLYFHAMHDGWRVSEVPVTKRYPRSGRGYTKMRPLRDHWRIVRPLLLLGLGIKK